MTGTMRIVLITTILIVTFFQDSVAFQISPSPISSSTTFSKLFVTSTQQYLDEPASTSTLTTREPQTTTKKTITIKTKETDTYNDNDDNNNGNPEEEKKHNVATLVPLSAEPILLTSSKPLLTIEECRLVRVYLDSIVNTQKQLQQRQANERMKKKSKGMFQQIMNNIVSTISSTPLQTTTSSSSSSLNDDIEAKLENNDSNVDDDEVRMGRDILKRVQSQIDDLTGSPWHSKEPPLPLYMKYEKTPTLHSVERAVFYQNENDETTSTHTTTDQEEPRIQCFVDSEFRNVVKEDKTTIVPNSPTRNQLVPNGLHLDIVNNFENRHISVLLYLSTCDNVGATTFPLANPLSGTGTSASRGSPRTDKLKQSVETMIQSNIFHTQTSEDNFQNTAVALEEAAVDVYCRDQQRRQEGQNMTMIDYDNENCGVRVVPSAGHIAVFCNMKKDGTPDFNSFHGGEALLDEFDEKVILAFFKQLPPPPPSPSPSPSIGSTELIAQKAMETREFLFQNYF